MLRQLRAKVACINTVAGGDSGENLTTGSKAIDRLLPRGGLRPDAITEWVAEGDGCGAAALAMIAAATHLKSSVGSVASSSGPFVVVSGPGNFYPPAAVSLGISADRIIWVQPNRHADLVWAIDQALRCESVAAVWAHVGANLDDRDARRFQLAAEKGRTPGLLIRPAATRGRPSFADVRFHIDNQPQPAAMQHSPAQREGRAVSPGRARAEPFSTTTQPHASPWGRVIQVTLDRCRGGTAGHSVWVRIDDQACIHHVTPQQLGIGKDETAAVRLASELAHPKTSNRKAKRAARLIRKLREPLTGPIVLWREDPRRGRLVVACDRRAGSWGVRVSMPIAQASEMIQAKAPGVSPQRPESQRPLIQPHDPALDHESLQRIAGLFQQHLTPLVAIEALDDKPWAGHPRHQSESLLCDITGVSHLFGGENGLLKAAESLLETMGLSGRMAIADSVGAAWALAHYGSGATAVSLPAGASRQAIEPLPVEALRLSPATVATLSRLGIERVGSTVAFAAKRFGNPARQRLGAPHRAISRGGG